VLRVAFLVPNISLFLAEKTHHPDEGALPVEKSSYVYILTNRTNTVFYIGVTNNISRRLTEHKEDRPGTFTAKYHLHKLVYVEVFSSIMNAIDRETQLKGWSRQKKMHLIRSANPDFNDLQEPYYDT